MATDLFASGGVPDAAAPTAGADLFAATAAAKPAPFKEGFGAGVQGVKSSLYGAGALVAHAVGAYGVEQKALAKSAEAEHAAAAQSRRVEDVDWTNPAAVFDHVKFLFGSAIPSLATMAAGGAAGRGLGAVLGAGPKAARLATLGGAVAPDVALESGSIYNEALKTGVENPAARAAIGGVAAASLDFVPLLAAERYLAAAGKGGFGAVAKGGAKGAVVGAGLEGTQEALQTVVERAAAGQTLTGAEANSDYLNAFAGGAVPGAGIGAVVGGHRGSKAAVQQQPAFTEREQPPAVNTPVSAVADTGPAPPVANSAEMQQVSPPLSLAATDEPLSLVPVPTPLEEAHTAHNAVEEQHTAATGAVEMATRKLAALDAELKLPADQRRTKEDIVLEQRQLAGEITAAQAQVKTLEPQLSKAREDLKTQEVLAQTPTGLNPDINTQPGVVKSDVIQTGPAAVDTTAAETAVAQVKRSLGHLVSSREAKLAPLTRREQALEIVNQRSGRKVDKQVDDKTRQGAIETAAVEAAQPAIDQLTTAAGTTKASKIVLTNALNTIAREAAAKGSVAEAQQHIGVEVPKALKGRVKSVDAAEVAASMIQAVGKAHTLYSKGATEKSNYDIARKEHSRLAGVEQDYMSMTDIPSLIGSAESELERPDEPGVRPITKLQREKLEAFVRKWKDTQNSKGAMTSEQFAALPQPAKNAAVDFYDQAMADRGQELITRLRDMVGHDPHLTVHTFAADTGAPIGGYTRTGKLKSLISMATNAKDGLSIADHEGFHYAEDRILTSAERQVVRNAFAPGSRMFKQLVARVQAYDLENKTHVADEILSVPAEARAYGFEFWKRSELRVEGALARVFAKLDEFFTKVANYIKGLGFQSAEDVFTALDRGQFAERQRNDAAGIQSLNSKGKSDDENDSGHAGVRQSGREIPSTTVAGKPAAEGWLSATRAQRNGKPHTLYRGSARSITPVDFEPENLGYASGNTSSGLGVFFTTSKREASGHGAVTSAHLDVRNPFVIEVANLPGFDTTAEATKYRESLRAKGYDSILIRMDTLEGKSNHIVVFDPHQVIPIPQTLKSVGAAEALKDMTRRYKAGELEREQSMDAVADLVDKARLSTITAKQAFGAVGEQFLGGLQRWRLKNIATGNYVSRFSTGYANVQKTLLAYVQRKSSLIAQGSLEQLSAWHANSTGQADITAVGRVLLERTEKGLLVDSPEFTALRANLTPHQQNMLTQATKMIAARLQHEFAVDQKAMIKILPGADYEEWFQHRQTQVAKLIEEGYVPERRYGDYTVHISLPASDPDAKPLTLHYEQFENQAAADVRTQQYKELIAREAPELNVESGYRYKVERDASISIQQFMDTARRNGVNLTQAERERLAKALVSADSMRRNRMFRRKNIPGYSEDIMRVLHEFVVTTANKVAYAEFAAPINDAIEGKPVDARTENGVPTSKTDDTRNLWKEDGPQAGFYRNLSDELSDYVLVPDHGGNVSKKLRGAAMMYFIGGSLAAGAVNAMSIPMNVVPWLSQSTGYANAFTKTFAAMGMTVKNMKELRDIPTLKDRSIAIPSVDAIPGLRDALVTAAEDGRTMDTEIHQIMGMAQGASYANSRKVQKAMDVWMAPFKMTEQVNRITTFIAAYKVGLENNLGGRQLYEFAAGAVDNTQNRYDEVNRPGLARDPMWALLFMFKSFPMFMVEMIEGMYRQNPKSATYMLLGLVAMTGVQGLPFAESIQDLIDTIAQKLFGSPFNSRRAMRNLIKDASEALVGADLSEIVLRGGVNDLTGISIASRVGLGDFVPGTRIGAADSDYGKVAEQVLGAPFSMVTGVGSAFGKVAKGDFMGALRAGGPVALRNLIKGGEQLERGYAQDAAGRKLVDATGPEALWQAMGFSSAALNKTYELDKIDQQTLAFYTDVRKDFTQQMVKAAKDGDAVKAQETMDAITKWNESNPDMPIGLSPAAMRRDIMMAGVPLNARTLHNLPRQLRGTSVAAEGISH